MEQKFLEWHTASKRETDIYIDILIKIFKYIRLKREDIGPFEEEIIGKSITLTIKRIEGLGRHCTITSKDWIATFAAYASTDEKPQRVIVKGNYDIFSNDMCFAKIIMA